MSHNDSTDIIFQKEQEWRNLLLDQLDKCKSERNNAELSLSEFKEKYVQLEIDFKHNLRLLHERDQELNELEQENSVLKESAYNCEEKISILCVEIDKLKMDINAAEEVKQEFRLKLQQVMEKGFTDLQAVKNDKIKDIQKIKDEHAEVVKNLERKLIQIEAETQENQYSLMADVEETLRSREGELKRETEQIHSEMLNYELKYRLASKELDLARISKTEIVKNLTEKENMVRELEMKLGEMELANKSEISIEKMKRQTEALHWKEREQNLIKEIEKLSRKIDEKNEKLRSKVEAAKRLENEINTVLHGNRERELEKENQIESLKSELEKNRRRIDELEKSIENGRRTLSGKDEEIARLVSRMTEENSKKDGELRNIRLEMENLVQQMRKKQEEMLELRNELEYAIGKDLESSKRKEGERELWEAKIEKVRIEEMAKVESMIKSITKTRDENLAEVRELRKQLEDRKVVRLCANCSQESYKNNPLVERKEENDKIVELSHQNSKLKEIIAKMTEEATNQVTNPPIEVNTSNRHIASLAERNRQLQQEKIELLATSRKLQARLEATELDNAEIKRKNREKETEISQLKFELDSLQRHTGMDVRTMRRTLQELETELSVSRKEAEEYYKGNLELGRVVEDLQSELTFLKTERIEKFPTLNFGAQEMLIEQLKKEINDLRGKLMYPNEVDEKIQKTDDKEILVLRKKLKAAANQIKNLASEKQVLIQISNRLSAELKQVGGKLPSSAIGGNAIRERVAEGNDKKDIKRTIHSLEDKLSRLEELQKNLRNDYSEKDVKNLSKNVKTSPDIISSVGRESVEEVFKLLDESDSLGQSSMFDAEGNHPLRPVDTKLQNTFLWSKSAKLNSQKSKANRTKLANR